jgi:FMN reductase [NAD(P)H]
MVHRERYQDPSDEELLAAFAEKYAGLRVEATAERLETLARVCQTVEGEELAARCLARVRECGYINPVQRYFGLHYRADRLPLGNDEFLRVIEQAGFGWFLTTSFDRD